MSGATRNAPLLRVLSGDEGTSPVMDEPGGGSSGAHEKPGKMMEHADENGRQAEEARLAG
jgi:hypothetical protein